MATATAYCTCSKCGAKFTRKKTCKNRREADSWETWAVSAFTECGDCFAKRRQAERETENKKNAEFAAAYTLPEIRGVSEAQIRYASDVRNRVISKHSAYMAKAAEIISAGTADTLTADYQKIISYKADFDKDLYLTYKAYIILTETEAKTIIKELTE